MQGIIGLAVKEEKAPGRSTNKDEEDQGNDPFIGFSWQIGEDFLLDGDDVLDPAVLLHAIRLIESQPQSLCVKLKQIGIGLDESLDVDNVWQILLPSLFQGFQIAPADFSFPDHLVIGQPPPKALLTQLLADFFQGNSPLQRIVNAFPLSCYPLEIFGNQCSSRALSFFGI